MINNNEIKRDPASFRDPSSRVYVGNGLVFREVYASYLPVYDHLMQSGLYEELQKCEFLIPHREVDRNQHYAMLEVDQVPFISYPYEWSFPLIQEAALTTLAINRVAMKYGMILKDASAYNMQIINRQTKLIDTCSFMLYQPGMPWWAYSQFLRHFLCPLLLIKYDHPETALKLLQTHIDGIPVPLAAHRMPFITRFKWGMWAHLFSQSLNFNVNPKWSVTINQTALTALLEHLYNFVYSLDYKSPISDLLQYAERGSYSLKALKDKKGIVYDMIQQVQGDLFLDLGSNTGNYSVIAVKSGKYVIAVDSSHDCICQLFQCLNTLPLVVDICQPSPGIGWANQERKPFWDRVGRVDCIMALAIIHHLCLKNNIPLELVADLLADHTRYLIIEWVPPEDPKAQQLLGNKQVPRYDYDTFIMEFTRHFLIRRVVNVYDSDRKIYFMERDLHG